MTAPTSSPAESRAQFLLMFGVGAVAGVASFAHVRALAEGHGQTGWLAWAIAGVVETLAVSSGMEIRRRKRTGQPTAAVVAVLFASVVLSLACQVADAERSVWGWILAAVPAVGFLVLVKFALSRTTVTTPEQVVALPARGEQNLSAPVDLDAAWAELDAEQERADAREQKARRKASRRREQTEQKPRPALRLATEQKPAPSARTDEELTEQVRQWCREQTPEQTPAQLSRYRVEQITGASGRQADRVLSAITEQAEQKEAQG